MESYSEEYISCEFLQSGLSLQNYYISSCNFMTKGYVFYDFTDSSMSERGIRNVDFDEILKKRKELLKNREIPKNCEGCFNLKKGKWNNSSNKISYLTLDHWRNCNCGCIYCSNRGHENVEFLTEEVTHSQFYDVLPLIEKIKRERLFDEKVVIQTIGGEPANLEEYPKIIQKLLELEDENLSKTEIGMLTSGIKYVPEIALALERPDKYLTISLDCGTRETYRKIKQIDAFDIVISNIEKYINHSKYKDFQVILKYILLPNINDNKEEIDKFFEIVQKVDCKQVNFSLEFCQALRHKQGQKIPENLYDLFDYAEEKAKNSEITFHVYDIVKDLLKKGHY